MLLTTFILEVPAEGFGGFTNKPATVVPMANARVSVSAERPRRRRRAWRNGRMVWISYNSYPRYRNYYSYPRYRVVPRYYWEDGYRRTRYVRIYF